MELSRDDDEVQQSHLVSQLQRGILVHDALFAEMRELGLQTAV